MTTDQLAVEAWKKIESTLGLLPTDGSRGIAIIKSAIEKANRRGYQDGTTDALHYTRAAHASTASQDYEARENAIHEQSVEGQAHASEQVCKCSHSHSDHRHEVDHDECQKCDCDWYRPMPRAAHASDDTKRLDWMDRNDCVDVIEDFLNNATPIREAIDAAMRKDE